MWPIKQFILTPVCIGCGSFSCGPSLFCNFCYASVVSEKLCAQQEAISDCGSKHIFLFEWSAQDGEEISQLVYRLKSDNSRLALRHYAAILAERLQVRAEGYAAVVPIPSANHRSVHALLLAEEIAKILDLPLLTPLEKGETAEQKTLSAAERSDSLNIQLREDSNEVFTSSDFRRQKYLCVDDVLTTGQSFKQASAALGGHSQNLIATLFYRSKTVGWPK